MCFKVFPSSYRTGFSWAAAYIIFGVVLQIALSFRKDESPVQKLPVVPSPFHQCALSRFCRMQAKRDYSRARAFLFLYSLCEGLCALTWFVRQALPRFRELFPLVLRSDPLLSQHPEQTQTKRKDTHFTKLTDQTANGLRLCNAFLVILTLKVF